MQIIDL